MNKWYLPETLFRKHYPDADNGIFVADIEPAIFAKLAANLEFKPDHFVDSKINDWEELPKLIIDPESRIVHGHEGRHRIAAMNKSGYSIVQIVVEIVPDPMRFDCKLDAMLEWEWNGIMPEWSELRTEQEWIDAIDHN